MRVNATFKRRRVASFFDVCSQSRSRLFSLHRRDVCAVSVLVSKHFFPYQYRIDNGGIGRYRVPDAGIGLTLQDKLLVEDQGPNFEVHHLYRYDRKRSYYYI